MQDFDPDLFQTKYRITEAAVDLYREFGANFALKQVADQADMEVGEIFDYFPDKKAILRFYYESLVIRYRLMLEEIDDFKEYTLAEKLSNFVYSSFDMMREEASFVDDTFGSLILYSHVRTGFESEIEELLKWFLEEDSHISASSSILVNHYLYACLRKKYLLLVRFWLNDKSEDQEASLELTDKFTSFLQEVMYSAAIDRGFDLARLMLENSLRSLKNLFPEIEIKN